MKNLLFIAILALSASLHAAQATVFKGRPSIKISEGGSSRTSEKIDQSQAVNLECVINKNGDEYFWASRENIPLVPVESGAFITFVAPNGAGYVRIIKNGLKRSASMMSETEETFDYTEHILIGLRSVTYYGASR